MTRFSFQRRIRTSSSEQYAVFDNEADLPTQAVGQVDIHYMDAYQFSASMALIQDAMDEESVEELIAALDDAVLGASSGGGERHVVVFFTADSAVYDFGDEDSAEEFAGEIHVV